MDAILIDKTGVRSAVVIEFTNSNLIIRLQEKPDQILLTYAFNNLSLTLGGNNDNLVFINSSNQQDISIYFEANNKNLNVLSQFELLSNQTKKIIAQKNKGMKINFSIAAIFLAIVFGLVYFRGPIAEKLSFFIPFKAEQKIASQIFNPKLTEGQKRTVDQLNQLTSKLVIDPKIWPYPFTFHISSEATPNAYATVGGHIFIHRGLITSVTNATDLLGVVAHEMIHVQKRHVVKSIVQAVGIYSLLAFLVGDVSGIAAVLADQGGPLLSLSYSRDLEEEADRIGMDLLVTNGIDPAGLANSLEVIYGYHKKLIDQTPGGEVLEKLQKIEILSSHPEIEKRIVNLRKEADRYKESKIFKPLDFDYESFQNQVKENF